MKTFDATITATITMSVNAESEGHAIGKIKKTIPTQVLGRHSGTVLYSIRMDEIHLTEVGIMDTSNGHNSDLVIAVNKAYREHKEDFMHIVRLLANRDSMEIVAVANVLPHSLDDKTLCHTYCQNVADDQDLETIINYCRI